MAGPSRGGPLKPRRRPHLDPRGAGRLVFVESAADDGPSGRDRFDAAVAAKLHEAGLPGDAEALQALAEAPLEAIGEVPYGSNAVFLVQLAAPDPRKRDAPLRAVYKPARGERPLWDFPRRTLYLREVATYLVDAELGLGHVPPTVLRDGPAGPGSMQLFVHAATGDTTRDEAALERRLRDVAMLDVLVNNADRKRSHLMLTEDSRLCAIDNALTFLPYPRQRTALISLGGTTLPRRSAKRVSALAAETARLAALSSRLAFLLSRIEVTAFEHRVRELAADPTYPVLDDWDGRPFDWW